jgi:uncharacterized membrane protein YtjA (UPF0391 family)
MGANRARLAVVEWDNAPAVMLNWTFLFLLVGLIAGILGFGVIAGTAALIAKICFVIFLVLFLGGMLTDRSKKQ